MFAFAQIKKLRKNESPVEKREKEVFQYTNTQSPGDEKANMGRRAGKRREGRMTEKEAG